MAVTSSYARVVAVAAAMAGFSSWSLSQPAYAGPNGQQVSIRVPGARLERVRISGDNQYDRAVTWDSSRAGASCADQRCEEVRAQGWWFKGKVTVEYQLRGERPIRSCHYYVNESQPDHWVNLLAPTDSHPADAGVGEANPRCIPATAAPIGASPNASRLQSLVGREISHGLCDRAIGPLESKAVAAATADVIAVITVTAIRGETGTLQIDQVLKAPPGAAVPRTLDVPGIPEDSFGRICRGNAALVGRRYIALLWNPSTGRSGHQLIAETGGLLIWSAEEQQSLTEALASVQPVSPWRAGPDGILTQLTLAPDRPVATGLNELNLLMIFRNTGAKPVTFRYRSWPPADQSRCEVDMVSESRQRVLAKDVPIARSAIEDYFQKHGHQYDWTTVPGESSTYGLARVTTATPGWGYKEELAFKYYPAAPGVYSVSVECLNFLPGDAKLVAGPIEVRLH
jgi:hypothetical protein